MLTDVFNGGAFDTLSLTTRGNDIERFPFVEQFLARYFEVGFVNDRVVQYDARTTGIQTVSDKTWGQVAPAVATTEASSSYPVNPVAYGNTVSITAADFRGLREAGTLSPETYQSIEERRWAEYFRSLDVQHERARASVLMSGILPNADGSAATNFHTLYSAPRPANFELQLDAASPEPNALRRKIAEMQLWYEGQLNGLPFDGLDIVADSELFEMLRLHPETEEQFKRWEDLVQPTESSLRPFRFAGVNFYRYRGAGIAQGLGGIIPLGVPGFLKTDFTVGDSVVDDGIARARYVSAELSDHNKGIEYEIASYPVHGCARPELLRGVTATSNP